MPDRIYIVEDCDLVRETLCAFISDLPDLEVCGAAESAEQALREISASKPDLLLVDLSLPQMNGADMIAIARQRWPNVRCLVLSGHGEAAYVERARAAGAGGYVLKGNPYELPDAIRRVLQGEEYLSKALP